MNLLDIQLRDTQLDLLADAQHAEMQAVNGPFFPERGITPEGLRAYAAKCRADAEHPATWLDTHLPAWRHNPHHVPQA